jgi:hypothetical protein
MQIIFEIGMWLLNVSLGVALGLWWSSYYYCKLLDQEKTWTDETLASINRIEAERDSVVSVNHDIARENAELRWELNRRKDAISDITHALEAIRSEASDS